MVEFKIFDNELIYKILFGFNFFKGGIFVFGIKFNCLKILFFKIGI